MDILGHLKQLLELIISKSNAAIICATWAILHIMLAYPAQFPQLRAYCDKYMHYLDIFAAISFSRLLVAVGRSIYAFARPRLRHWRIKRAAIKKIKRILKTPGSDEYKLVMLLHREPNTQLNLMEPIVKHLASWGIICVTAPTANASPLDGIYRVPFNLTHTIRQYVNTHSIPPHA